MTFSTGSQVGRSVPFGAGQSCRMLGVFFRPMEGGLRVFRVMARQTSRELGHNSPHESLLRPRSDDTPSENHRRGREHVAPGTHG